MPIPRDEKGRQISQIESGFTTLYVSSKPKLVDLDRIQDISNVFNGAINPTDLSTKSGKFVPVGLESESVSFTILRNKRYYLLNTYPDFPDHVIVIELTKIIDRDDVNIFTLKTPFGKNVFLYPSLAKVLIGAGKSIK